MADEVKKEEGVAQAPPTPQQIIEGQKQECIKEIQAALNKYNMKLEALPSQIVVRVL